MPAESRRFSLVVLVFGLGLLGFCPWMGGQEGSEFVRGDVNRDTRVSIADLSPLIGHVLLNSLGNLSCPDAGDVDDSGSLDLGDVISLLFHLFYPTTGDALPFPYPAAGVDPTGDSLGCGAAPFGDGGNLGDELQHIFFAREGRGTLGLAGYPGQTKVRLPVYLETIFPLDGYTVSLQYNPKQVKSPTFDFRGSAAAQFGADLTIHHVVDGDPSYIYAYVVSEVMPPYDSPLIPPGDELLLGTVVADLSPDLSPGESVAFTLVPTPSLNLDPPVYNEISVDGNAILPVQHSLELPIHAESQLFIRGDVSRDGSVNIIDAVNLIRGLVTHDPGFPGPCPDASDINDDGYLNISDAVQLLHFVFAEGVEPADPYPFPGIDATPDSSIDCH